VRLAVYGVDTSCNCAVEGDRYTVNEKPFLRKKSFTKRNFSKAVRDLKHDPEVTPEEGIKRTVEWMKGIYINTNLQKI